MKPQSASSFTLSITSLFTMTFLLFTPTSCCPQGSTHLSEEKKRTVHLLSFGVPRIGKSDYLKKNKKVVFQINKYNCIHWGLLQLALSADMHAAATHSFGYFSPTPHALVHPLLLNQNLPVKAHSADKALPGWSKPKFVRNCILCSACLSMHVRFRAPTPTHVELSADAETSAQSSKYWQRGTQ